MRIQVCTAALAILMTSVASAQVASHAPTVKPGGTAGRTAVSPGVPVVGKAVARVNGVVLTDRDLLTEMYAIFPYARQHNGFPKDIEPQIRKGALDMIIFNELVFQEARRRKLTVPAARISRAEAEFRDQFPSQSEYEQFLKQEMAGSRQVLRDKLKRSLLIDALLKTELRGKSVVTAAETKAFYDKNASSFMRPETFHIQSISILPPSSSPEVLKEARKRAEEALKQAKTATTYRDFGLLAEKISEDDFRVNMGDHKPIERDKLPPEIVKAALAMKPGQVSDLIQLGDAFTIFRLHAHTPAGKVPLAEVQKKLKTDLEKQRLQQLRTKLGERLRKNARIEKL